MNKIATSLVSICILSASLANANETKEIKIEAKQAIMKMGKSLKMKMKKSMKDGGVENAFEFCALSASDLESSVNKTYNTTTSVKRVTLKPRNQNNKASADETLVLQSFEKMKKDGKKLPKLLVKEISKNHYKVYKPMLVGDVCLKCHGNSSKMNPKVKSLIKKYYPNDKAISYKKGDIRGAFIAEIIKNNYSKSIIKLTLQVLTHNLSKIMTK